jgi:urease accessory protein
VIDALASFSGHLSLLAESRPDGRTVLTKQSFRAPLHLSKPYWDEHALIAQVVNPTAGILSGDELRTEVHVRNGARLLLTAPSATRVFTMLSGSARAEQRFVVEGGGFLEVWPEPLVPHRAARYRQDTVLEVAESGEALVADFFLPGRVARAELWAWDRLTLNLRVVVGGDLVLRERFDQTGEELRQLAELAGKQDGAAFGNLVLVSPALENAEEEVKAIAASNTREVSVGISRLRGKAPAYSIKLIAPDGDALRRAYRDLRRLLCGLLPALRSDPRKL